MQSETEFSKDRLENLRTKKKQDTTENTHLY